MTSEKSIRMAKNNHIPHSQNPFEEGWINGKEDLFYRGANPPQGSGWKDEDWVYLPHENYIPVSKHRILSVLQAEIADQCDATQLEHFIRLLGSIYHFHYHKTLDELKEDYEYFAPRS